MCFSPTADFVAAAAITPVAAVTLRNVRHRDELAIGLLPTLGWCVYAGLASVLVALHFRRQRAAERSGSGPHACRQASLQAPAAA